MNKQYIYRVKNTDTGIIEEDFIRETSGDAVENAVENYSDINYLLMEIGTVENGIHTYHKNQRRIWW